MSVPLLIGYLDGNGHPKLTIRVSGTHPTAFTDVEAMIDTGFTGFLMLPLAQALPLGLPLYGTANYTLANGQVVTNFVADGTVTILPPSQPSVQPPPGGTFTETTHGAIVLGGDDALLGMEFIRSLDKLLIVGKIVALLDQSGMPSPSATP
jgi:predicted aspartyl protease